MTRSDRAELLRRLGATASAALSGAPAGGGGGFSRHPNWNFAFLSHLTIDPTFVALQYGLEDACALVGCSFSWGGSARGDVDELAQAFDLAISARADGIGVSLVNPKALDGLVERASRAGIPVIAVNARAPGDRSLALVGMNPKEAGAALGARIVAMVGRGEVALFVGDREVVALRPLADAVVAHVERSGSPVSVRIVSTGPDVYSELQAVYDYASANKQLRGLFALDAGSTEGLAFALDKLGPGRGRLRAGGTGVLPATLKLIADGTLDFTIDEQPYLQGFEAALQLFLARISGGLVAPADVRTGPIFVTKENVGRYLNTRTRYEGSSSKQKYPIS